MPLHLELGHQALSPSPGTPSGQSKEEVGARDRHGQAGLAGGSWQQLQEVLGQLLVSPLAEAISTPAVSQGFGEKGKNKKMLSKVFPFPGISPRVSSGDSAATGMCGNAGGFGTGLGGCKLFRRRTHPQVSEQNHPHRPPPHPGLAQVRVLTFGSLAQACANVPSLAQGFANVPILAQGCASVPRQGRAPRHSCRCFTFQGVKELKFSDGKRTEDQTSSLVTSRCWDIAAPQHSPQFHPSVGRAAGAAAGRCEG